MKNLIILFIIVFILTACAGMEEAGKVLRNEKIRTTDEFLVKKRNPLEIPPDLDTIPKPNTSAKKKSEDSENIKKVLNAPIEEKISTQELNSIENSILEKIKQ